jgi:hypothetical protein
MILSKMKLANRSIIPMSELVDRLDIKKLDVLATIGAGDIDRLVAPIEEKLKREAAR